MIELHFEKPETEQRVHDRLVATMVEGYTVLRRDKPRNVLSVARATPENTRSLMDGVYQIPDRPLTIEVPQGTDMKVLWAFLTMVRSASDAAGEAALAVEVGMIREEERSAFYHMRARAIGYAVLQKELGDA